MGRLETVSELINGVDVQKAWQVVQAEVDNIDNFVDIVDWSGGNYQDDSVNHLFVAVDSGGEYMTTVYQFKARDEVLKELTKVFRQFDEEFLSDLKGSNFAVKLNSALKGSLEFTNLGIFSGGTQGTQMLAVYFEG